MRVLIGYVFLILSLIIYLACGTENNETNPIEPETDLAPYAIQNATFDCNKLKEQIGDKTFSIAFLWSSFGDSNECLRDIFGNRNMGLFEIHSMNHFCLKLDNGCSQEHEVYEGSPERFEQLLIEREGWLLEKIANRMTEIKAFLDNNPTMARCYISTGLETQLPAIVNDRIVTIVRAILPECDVVYNPVFSTQDRGLADYIEIHERPEDMQAPCFGNLDGNFNPNEFPNFKNITSHCDAQFFWQSELSNCFKRGNKFIFPHLRNCSTNLHWNDFLN